MDFKLMNESRKNGKYTDFTIHVEDKSFPVHRVVLARTSEYFERLFSVEMAEKEEKSCDMKDLTAVAVEKALDYLYREDLILDEETVFDALAVCHRWRVLSGVDLCENFFVENLVAVNVILANKVSKLYDLEELRTKCSEFILSNLKEVNEHGGITEFEMKDILEILAASIGKDISGIDLWTLCTEWGKFNYKKNSYCNLILSFPFEMLTTTEIQEFVIEETHIVECQRCKDHVQGRILKVLKSEAINIINCISLKLLARSLKYEKKEILADKFIVQHHKEAFALRDFLDLEESDILKYVTSIKAECSPEEFRSLMNWIRFSPEREAIFPKLFEQKDEDYDSLFLRAIRSISCRSRGWLILAQDCFFVKELAEKYEISFTLERIDAYISSRFSEIIEMPEFAELSLESVTGYLRKMDSVKHQRKPSHKFLWNAVTIWLNRDLRARKQHFLKLLQSLPLKDFSFEFIKEKVLKCPLFSEIEVYLTKIVLDRAIDAEPKRPARFSGFGSRYYGDHYNDSSD